MCKFLKIVMFSLQNDSYSIPVVTVSFHTFFYILFNFSKDKHMAVHFHCLSCENHVCCSAHEQ